jgi:hypothetical protein
MFIEGWGEGGIQLGSRFVSSRACVRACEHGMWFSEIWDKSGDWLLPSPLSGRRLSPSPHDTICPHFPCEQYFVMISRILIMSAMPLIPMRPKESM